jgi:filamentous hemagglutinin
VSFTDPSGFFLKRIAKFFKRLFRHVGSFGRRLIRRWGRQIVAVAAAWFAGGAVSGWAQGAQLGDIGVSIGAAGGLAAEGAGAVATLTASVPASTVLGGIAGGAIAGAISSGSLSGAGMGALSGGVTAGIGGYYGGGYGAGRVLAEAAVGGVTSELSGGDFARGALVSGGLSTLTWASLEMRRVMIEQSRINRENATGISAGFRGDVFKLGGSRQPSGGSPLGGVQGGRGNVFGIEYGPGSFLDLLVETYAGPHDFLNAPLFYNELGNNASRPYALEAINAANVLVATPFAAASVIPPFAYGALGD